MMPSGFEVAGAGRLRDGAGFELVKASDGTWTVHDPRGTAIGVGLSLDAANKLATERSQPKQPPPPPPAAARERPLVEVQHRPRAYQPGSTPAEGLGVFTSARGLTEAAIMVAGLP